MIHDAVGHTLTVWWDDPRKEHVCAETTEEVVLLHYRPSSGDPNLTVETVVQTDA